MDLEQAFKQLAASRLPPLARAQIEQELFQQLITDGMEAVSRKLLSLHEPGFRLETPEESEQLVRLVSGSAGRRIAVTLYESEDLSSISLDVEGNNSDDNANDSRHDWFYRSWENLQGLTDRRDIESLPAAEKAVYLVALLEAEIMNGGLGQYLANTQGLFLDDTIDCLKSISALETCKLLRYARQLKNADESYDDIRTRKAQELGELDDGIFALGEDLAGLVADRYGEI